MFHIQGLDGIQFNIPLEDLRRNDKVYKLEKSDAARKVIDRNESRPGGEKLSHAINAYTESVKTSSEREQLLHAYEIMKSPVLTIKDDMNVADAWNYLKEKDVKHMPVISKEDKIIGILSERDILKCLCILECSDSNIADKKVIEIMTRKVITAGKLTDIRRIAKAMFENHVGIMPIVEDSGELAGIITRSDILYALVNYPPLSLWA